MTAFVSTGRLPPPEQVRALVAEAHVRFRSNAEWKTLHPPVAPAIFMNSFTPKKMATAPRR